jgi:hypothetical protein
VEGRVGSNTIKRREKLMRKALVAELAVTSLGAHASMMVWHSSVVNDCEEGESSSAKRRTRANIYIYRHYLAIRGEQDPHEGGRCSPIATVPRSIVASRVGPFARSADESVLISRFERDMQDMDARTNK